MDIFNAHFAGQPLGILLWQFADNDEEAQSFASLNIRESLVEYTRRLVVNVPVPKRVYGSD